MDEGILPHLRTALPGQEALPAADSAVSQGAEIFDVRFALQSYARQDVPLAWALKGDILPTQRKLLSVSVDIDAEASRHPGVVALPTF